jgi:hypothetical protein
MSLLARLQTLGLAKEATPGTYVPALRSVPITAPKPEDVITPLRDESIRGNDAVLQGIYGGASWSTFDYTIPHLYPDVLGDHVRAILGPDTLTAGITTTLSASVVAGATSITTAVSIPTGSTIMIDTGVKTEYFTSGTPTGAGPYTIPVTAGMGAGGNSLLNAHTSAVAVVSASTHTFKQDQRANPIPTYSLSQFNKIETRGFTGCVESDFGIKIDPKGAVSADAKWMGMPSATQSNVAAVFSNAQPVLGWQWGLTLAGVASTRGITGDYTLKRATAAIHASNGAQAPREIFAGALECDFKMKAIFENNLDYTQFTGYTSVPIVSTLTQPLAFGGSVITITSTGQKFIKFVPDYSGTYLACDIDSSGVNNTTDNGVLAVSVSNFINTAY